MSPHLKAFADEQNEISLREGELITQIEEIDEGWWSGTNAAGQSGLFPSNYVELVEGEPEPPAEAAIVAPPAPPPMPAQVQTAEAADEAEAVGEVYVAQYE